MSSFKKAYPNSNINENASLPSLSGENVYWSFPQYNKTQEQYARNGLFLGKFNH